MKRLICSILVIASLLMTACGQSDPYPPIKSTDEEARVVMTLSLDGKTYDVKYELYRAFFLMYRPQVDGGDPSAWHDENAAQLRAQIDALVEKEICRIYAVLALCDRIRYDLYSKQIDDLINTYVAISVEGGFVEGDVYEGYGTYEAYLDSLKRNYVNYSVQDLLFRYSAGIEALDYYFAGDINAGHPGAIEYTAEQLRDFYNEDSTAHVIWHYISSDRATPEKTLEQQAEEARAAMQAILDDGTNTFEKLTSYIISHSIQAEADVVRGNIVTPYSLDPTQYADLSNAALALSVGELSAPVYVQSDDFDGYFIVYRMEKTEDIYPSVKDKVLSAYLQDRIGRMLDEAERALAASRKDTDVLHTIDPATISMEP